MFSPPRQQRLDRRAELVHASGMRLCLSLVLLALLAPLYGANTSSDQRIEMFYGMAQGNYLIGDYSGASKGINEILRLQPNFLPALKLKARLLLDQGKSEAALLTTEQAILLAPADLENQLLKALILGNLARREDAVSIINQVLSKAPPNSGDFRAANQLLGLLRMAEGNWDEAAAAFNNNYLAAPDASAESLQLASEAYLEKARLAIERQETNEAVAAIDQAIALHKDTTGTDNLRKRASLRLLRARVLTQAGRTEEAIAELQSLTGQQPDNLEALVTLASLYAATERWESVDKLVTPIAQQPALQDVALYLEGRAAFAQSRIGKARAKFEEALELQANKNNRLAPSLHFYRSHCLSILDRNEEAGTELLKALDANFIPETADEAIFASSMLLQLKQAKRAIPILEAITLNRIHSSAEVWALLGRAQQASGNNERAISAFNESLRQEPEQIEVLALRAALFRKVGELNAAAADYERAILKAPENPALPYALALVYFQIGQLSDASLMMIKAAQHHPKRADIPLLQALISYTLGDTAEAQAALDYYFKLQSGTPNETARYLEYALAAPETPGTALEALEQHAADSVSLGYFYSYCTKNLTRKQMLDHAGKATSQAAARAQICEALFWMAQHEYSTGSVKTAEELLRLILDFKTPDLPEYQLAKWQLAYWR